MGSLNPQIYDRKLKKFLFFEKCADIVGYIKKIENSGPRKEVEVDPSKF
jgi:hypothetical protein